MNKQNYHRRLNHFFPHSATYAWVPDQDSQLESWIQADLLSTRTLAAIITEGRQYDTGFWRHLEAFVVHYSMDASDWMPVSDVTGSDLVFANVTYHREARFFPYLVMARFVRLYPREWRRTPTMKWELWGY